MSVFCAFLGTYVLTLKGPSQKLEFKFEVTIEQSPRVVQEPPRNVFVPQGDKVQITAAFEGRLTSRVSFVLLNFPLFDTFVSPLISRASSLF